MCLIAIVPQDNTSLTELDFQRIQKQNSDGIGFTYVSKKGKLRCFKSIKLTPARAFTYFTKLKKKMNPKFPIVVHWRLGSNVTKENCHPFRVASNVAFVHNGYITIPKPYGQFSDTWHFARLLRSYFGESIGEKITQRDYQGAIAKSVGPNNKLCFSTNNPNCPTVTIGEFYKHDGVHYSNLFWLNRYHSYSVTHSSTSNTVSNTPSNATSNTASNTVSNTASNATSNPTTDEYHPNIQNIVCEEVSYLQTPRELTYKRIGDRTFLHGTTISGSTVYVELKSGSWPTDIELINLCISDFNFSVMGKKGLNSNIASAVIREYPNLHEGLPVKVVKVITHASLG